jgi:uncharacterized coiled-coil DUF342 family protein
MNYKNFWKTMLSFGLLVSLILPSASLANVKSKTPSNLVKNEIISRYNQLAAKYLVDCDDLAAQTRPSGERLKRCLTIAKELRDKFAEFILTLDTLVKRIKGVKKWTNELDEQLLKESSKLGIDAETANDIRRAGGFRRFYESSIRELEFSKGELDLEVKELEAKPASENQIFQKASFVPTTEYKRVGRLKRILRIVKKIAVAILAACELAGDACD